MKTAKLACACLAAAALAAGCDDDGSVDRFDSGVDGGTMDVATPDTANVCTSGGASGQVQVVVQAPVPLMPQARLVGPSGTVDLSAGTPVAVPPGFYQVEWRRVKVSPAAGEFIGKAFYVSAIAFDGCVRSGVTNTATLTYMQEPGSGKAWVTPANGAGAVLAYDEAQLRAGAGATMPAVVRKLGVTATGDLAFDLEGNLWLSDTGVGGGIVAYPMLTLGEAADRAPTLKIPAFERVSALAFDGEGNLWAAQSVAGAPSDRILKFAAASLSVDGLPAATTTSRTVAPALELTSPELKNIADIAFDTAGNLWATSRDKDQVMMFTPAQLAAGGSVAPTVAVKAARATGPLLGALKAPRGLAFDAAGNLWVGWENVVKLTPAQQTATATVADPITVSPQGMGGAGVSEAPFAIDAAGGMWLSRTKTGSNPAALVRIPAEGLSTAGMQMTNPNMGSEALGNGVGSIVFNPAPTNVPIRN